MRNDLRYIINNLDYESNALCRFFVITDHKHQEDYFLIANAVDFKVYRMNNCVVIESLQKGESYPTAIIDSKRCMFNVIEELQEFIDTYR